MDSRGTLTDWARIKSMSDGDVDLAIAGDPDAYALEPEVLGRPGSAYRYEIYSDAQSHFYWRLVSEQGQVLASGNRGFASRADAKKAIAEVRAALLGGRPLAA